MQFGIEIVVKFVEGQEPTCANLAFAGYVLEILPTREKYQESKNHHGKGVYMDPIADMIVTIKNGYLANLPSVIVPLSKFKLEIAKTLEKEKFVGDVQNQDKKIAIKLLYENQKPKISQIKRVSKLGLRVYIKSKKIQTLKGGLGVYILSTPLGVMTSKEARQKKVGGEIVCKVW